MSETTTASDRAEERRQLTEKAKLLWQLVTTTRGVADLAEPMARVERNWDRLSKGQQVTIAVIAKQFSEGCHAIEETKPAKSEVKAEGQPETSAPREVVTPDEIIPPGQATGETA